MKIFLAICLNFSSLVFAKTLTDKEITAAANLLAEDFRPYVTELDRDVKVYHYFDSLKINRDLPLHSPEFDHALMSSLNYTWIENTTGIDFRHDPFYAASDPGYSRTFGHQLLEITIHKGAHVLVGHHLINYSPATIAAIGNIYSFRFDAELDRIPRAVLAKALAILDVEVATYSYIKGQGSTYSSIACAKTVGTFMLLGTPVDLSKAAKGSGVITKTMTVVGYTDYAADFSDPEKRAAYARIDRFLNASNLELLTNNNEQADLSPLSKEEFADWHDEIYTCDNVHSADEPRPFRPR